jgi:prolyl-tRNA synthetase
VFGQITKNLAKRAREFLEEHTRDAPDAKSVKRALSEGAGIVRIAWCGKESCGLKLEEETGADILGPEFKGKKIPGKCPVCGKKTETSVLMAKTY